MEFWAEVGDGNPRYGKTEYTCLRGVMEATRVLKTLGRKSVQIRVLS